jgi:hypothetical protein
MLNIVVHPKIANSEFPRGDRVGPHGLSIPGFHVWLIQQLPVHFVENHGTLARAKRPQMVLGIG